MKEVPVAVVVSVGDEVLAGKTVDSNSAWLGAQLTQMGFRVGLMLSVPDNHKEIVEALELAIQKGKLVVVTGGLGPTVDDRTREAVAQFVGVGLEFNETAWQDILDYARRKGVEDVEALRPQAFIPEGACLLRNREGSAAGFVVEKDGVWVVCLPGVPSEMKLMFREGVVPFVCERFVGVGVRYSRTIRIIGVPEIEISQKLKPLEKELEGAVSFAYYPSLMEVRVVLSALAQDDLVASTIVNRTMARAVELLGEGVYGFDDDSLSSVVGNILRERGLWVATAESCTGGYIAHLITSIPGSSDYFRGTVVAYSNEVKKTLLGVKEEHLQEHGAVSEPVVRQMAEGVMGLLGVDCAVATSGIAGPSGATPTKPVGTVWIAAGVRTEGKSQIVARKYLFHGTRLQVIEQAALTALDLLRRLLLSGSG